MAQHSPKQASPIYRKLTHVLLTALLAPALHAWADAGSDAQNEPAASAAVISSNIRPYTAEYKTKTRGMSLTLARELKPGTGDEWILTNGGKILVAGFHETSVFRLEAEQIMPKSYVYQGTGLINRRREVHFTEGSDIIRSLYKDVWYELPYTPGTLDRMSQQEQLRFSLLADPTPKEDVVVRVADGKRVKEYILTYVGEETLKTKMGSIKTLHFERIHDSDERSSDFWIAPEWDYMMVKTVHVEDGSPTEAVLVSGSIEGKKIGGK
jgi:hypothetical protein